jgi:hypothetical protein
VVAGPSEVNEDNLSNEGRKLADISEIRKGNI